MELASTVRAPTWWDAASGIGAQLRRVVIPRDACEFAMKFCNRYQYTVHSTDGRGGRGKEDEGRAVDQGVSTAGVLFQK